MPAAVKSAAAAAKPTYAVMVAASIKALGDRTGSSVQAISKHVTTQYKMDVNKHALSKAIKKGVESGDFVQIKSSYKLSKKAAPKPPTKSATKKKTVVKKKVVKATVKSKTAKSTPSKKKSLKPRKTLVKKTTKKVAKKSSTMTKKAATKKKTSRK